MSQFYQVPNIYQDNSNQSQGCFAFRFVCQHCQWQIDTTPIRSSVSTATNIMDIGVGMLGGFWGRAAQAGEQIYGTQWHKEQAQALQKSWAQIEQSYEAPRFNVGALPSAATPDMLRQPAQQLDSPGQNAPQLSPAALIGMGTPGYPQSVACPTCRRVGPPGKFCQDCGTKLPMPDLFCPGCSAPVESTARFCVECGAKLHG
jgi:Double zinc ribbon